VTSHTKTKGIFRDNKADYQIWVNLGNIISWYLFSQHYIIDPLNRAAAAAAALYMVVLQHLLVRVTAGIMGQ
jgi:hypothetical protein